MEILTAKNLSFTYPSCYRKALDSVSISIEEGDFVCLCGTTGSGKSTFLRLFKPELSSNGTLEGELLYRGQSIDEIPPEARVKIGYVMQNPDEQIVCDKVWHELCFGLENLAYPQPKMQMKVAEISAYFGLGGLLEKNVSELSGGQKQLLNLAAVMTMEPEVLLLDEPCAQLDPVSASSLLDIIAKVNREFGTTVIMVEHRLDGVIPLADKMIALDNGKVVVCDKIENAVQELSAYPPLSESMSAPVWMYHSLGNSEKCPLTVKDGAKYLRENFSNEIRSVETPLSLTESVCALEFKNVYFRYTRDGKDILDNLSFSVQSGELFCILGENGCGKSTALLAASGIHRIQSGKIRVFDKDIRKYKGNELYNECLIYLPQDVKTAFLKNTVREELAGAEKVLEKLPFDFTRLLDKHPYDLSGGESQLLALAKALSLSPRILLLDEPTKGLDTHSAVMVGKMLSHLVEEGMTVVCVTHDTQFAADFADRCAMMFDGKICAADTPRNFFSGNSYYTTPYSRMSRGFFDNAVTLEDICELCRINAERRVSDDTH